MYKVTWLSSTTDLISSFGLMQIKFSNLLKIVFRWTLGNFSAFYYRTPLFRTPLDECFCRCCQSRIPLMIFSWPKEKNYAVPKGFFKFGRSRPERYFMTTQILPTLSDNVDLLVWSWNSVKSALLVCCIFFCLKLVYNSWTFATEKLNKT